MSADETELSPEIRGKLRYFNRVLMSYIDFQQASNIAHVILRDRLHERLLDPGPGDRFLLQGLNCAMIVAYCRPFSGNDRGATVKIPDLPGRFLRVLIEEERGLHEIVMKDRDSRLAHSDSDAWEMEPVVCRSGGGHEMLVPMHHSVHAPLTREATECFRGMADKLLEACFAERRRLEPELRLYFRVLERSSEELRQEIPPPSAFKAHFGMSATEWRRGGAESWPERRRLRRKLGKQLRNRGNARRPRKLDTPPRRPKEGAINVRVQELPARHVVYMRYVGPYGAYGIPELWTRFHKWMGARGLSADTIRLGLAHDDAAITRAEKCRYDACLVVPADFRPDRWVNAKDIPGGTYAVWEFTGTAHEIQGAWDRVFTAWLPYSGYQPDDRPCFEVYRGTPGVGAKAGIFRCELCLPVKAL